MAESLAGGKSVENEAEKAVTSAYRCHADELYRFCLRWTNDPALAEEALATVFLEAWRRHQEVDFSSMPIRPWLYGVARNVLRNQQRTQRRQEEAARNLVRLNRCYAEDPAEELARRETACALVGSLQSLPDGQRQVVALCLLGGSSYEAAAGDLQVAVGTVRSRLSRARLNLALAVRAAHRA